MPGFAIALLLLPLPLSLLAPAEEVHYVAPSTLRDPAAVYGHGYLALYDPETPDIALYDGAGHLVYETAARTPGGSLFRIRNLSAARDGSVVLAGYWSATDEGLLKLDPTGKAVQAVSTYPFQPHRIAAGLQEDTWVLGFLTKPGRTKTPGLRRYGRNGALLSEPLSPSELTGDLSPAACTLAASNSRAAVWLDAGSEWIEFHPDGSVADRFGLRPPPGGTPRFTFSGSGEIYNKGRTLQRFDRKTGRWVEVDDVLPEDMPPAELLDARGPRLVFRVIQHGAPRIMRLPH